MQFRTLTLRHSSVITKYWDLERLTFKRWATVAVTNCYLPRSDGQISWISYKKKSLLLWLSHSILPYYYSSTDYGSCCLWYEKRSPSGPPFLYIHTPLRYYSQRVLNKGFFFLLLLLHFSAGQTDGADALWDWNRQQQSKRNGRTSISHTQQCISNKMARLCNVKHKHPQHIVIIYFKREEIDEKIFQGVSKETLITLLQRKLRQYFCRQIEEMVCVCVCVCVCVGRILI